MTSIGANLGNYAYNGKNQRVWRKATVSGQSVEQVFFYGIDGKAMGTYGLTVTAPGNQQPVLNLAVGVQSLYFGGRLIGRTNWLYTNSFQPISGDLVGTVRWDAAVAPNGVTESFWPWGEERGTVTANDRVKYGTYWRDSESSLDYAMNRYYSSVTGRFLEADPYGGSAKAGNPQSWNRYAYVEGDPVGGGDPTGLDDAADGGDGGLSFNFNDFGGDGGYGGSSGSGPVQYTGSDITGYDSNGMPIVGDPATSGSVGVSTDVTPVAYDPSTTTFPVAGVGPAGGGTGKGTQGVAATSGGNGNPTPTRLFGTHWCGPGGAGPTVNALDQACQAHDTCYVQSGFGATSNYNPLLPLPRITALQQCNQSLCNAATGPALTNRGSLLVYLYFSLVPVGACVP